jgi:hypothetical protein
MMQQAKGRSMLRVLSRPTHRGRAVGREHTYGKGSAAPSCSQVEVTAHGTMPLGALGKGKRRGKWSRCGLPTMLATPPQKSTAAGRGKPMPREKSRGGARAKLVTQQVVQPRAGKLAVRAGEAENGSRRSGVHSKGTWHQTQAHTAQMAVASEGGVSASMLKRQRHHMPQLDLHLCRARRA